MDENAYAQILQVIERRYQEGYKAGQAAAIRDVAVKLAATFPTEPKPRRPRRAETRPRRKNPGHVLIGPVEEAISRLAATHLDGVDVAAIAAHLTSAGHEVDPRDFRLALRQLTLSGAIFRAARGRYVPANLPASDTPISAAAE